MHLAACMKLMHLFRLEFQICVMNRLSVHIMVRNLEFVILKTFNQQNIEIQAGEK